MRRNLAPGRMILTAQPHGAERHPDGDVSWGLDPVRAPQRLTRSTNTKNRLRFRFWAVGRKIVVVKWYWTLIALLVVASSVLTITGVYLISRGDWERGWLIVSFGGLAVVARSVMQGRKRRDEQLRLGSQPDQPVD